MAYHPLKPFESQYRASPSGCWLWIGRRTSDGYGAWGRRRAHRASYEIHRGPIPQGMVICHACDTPLCVNPEHLWMGTTADNVRDAIAKGRGQAAKNAAKTHCPSGHEYSPENTYLSPLGRRFCRACTRAAQRAYQQRKAGKL